MVIEENVETLRKSALDHLWMSGMDWVKMAEEGNPPIVVEGKGIRVTDSEGKSWIDVNAGYASVNVGYGRTEIADAVRDQMMKLSYYPINTATESLSKLADVHVELPMRGIKQSLNVSVAVGVVGYEFSRYYTQHM